MTVLTLIGLTVIFTEIRTAELIECVSSFYGKYASRCTFVFSAIAKTVPTNLD